jgi:hypothetical protein
MKGLLETVDNSASTFCWHSITGDMPIELGGSKHSYLSYQLFLSASVRFSPSNSARP